MNLGYYGERRMIDHRELLLKYIQHVEKSEDVDCILTRHRIVGHHFTPEEWAELEALALVARESDTSPPAPSLP